MRLRFSEKEIDAFMHSADRPLTPKDVEFLAWSYDSFPHFVYSIYRWAVSKHFGEFVGGPFITDECKFLQENPYTITVEPRGHWKSMRLYAYLMWRLWRNRVDRSNLRVSYFSYRKRLADEHIQNLKYLVDDSVFRALGLIDEKNRADTLARYTWDSNQAFAERKRMIIRPYGLLEFSRGAHSEIVIVDDPLKDDSDPNARTNVWKINSTFVSVVMNIPTRDGCLHVVGTPQTEDDFLFDPNIQKEFIVRIKPAIFTENGEEKALWPQMFPIEKLKQMRESRKIKLRGGVVSTFEQEFMCQPRAAAFSYFDAEMARKAIDVSLPNNDFATTGMKWQPTPSTFCIAGYDPGKKLDPGHFVVLEVVGNQYIQRLSKWFDNVDYFSTDKGYSQIGYIARAHTKFNISTIYADNTRGELYIAEERHLIPNLSCQVISLQKKTEMAQAIDSALMDGSLRLVDDPRQLRQLMNIQQDLSCSRTSEGHGEPLTSIGLPLLSMFYRQGRIEAQRGSYLLSLH